MSKFDKIFEARDTEEKTGTNAPVKTEAKGNAAKKSKARLQNSPESEKQISQIAESEIQTTQLQQKKQRGRPQAKRSDPSYIGFTTYIRKDTHLNVKISLLQEGQGRELSELVESLLSDWVTKNRRQ